MPASPPQVSLAQRRARLAVRHRLAASAHADDIAAIADSLVALYSSDPVTVYLSVAARMVDPSLDAVARALYDEHTVVRHHAMRRTSWVMTPEVTALAHAACTTGRVRPEWNRIARMVESSGITNDGNAWLTATKRDTLAAPHRLGAASTRRIGSEVPELTNPLLLSAGKPYEATPAAHTRVMLLLGFDGAIVRGRPSGTWINGQYTWMPMDAVVPGGLPAIDPAVARADLVRRWLYAFGPATSADIQWWLDARRSTLGAVRAALATVDAVQIEHDRAGDGCVARPARRHPPHRPLPRPHPARPPRLSVPARTPGPKPRPHPARPPRPSVPARPRTRPETPPPSSATSSSEPARPPAHPARNPVANAVERRCRSTRTELISLFDGVGRQRRRVRPPVVRESSGARHRRRRGEHHQPAIDEPAMKLGLHFQTPCGANLHPAQRYRHAIEQCVTAEACGFESVWPVEQHFDSPASVLPAPHLLLAAIASRTTTVRLGTGVTLLPLHHPVRLAEEVATLDVLSDGRVECGVGRGMDPAHFAGFGVPHHQSAERFDEGLTMLRDLLTHARFTTRGRFHQIDDGAITPRPVQQPCPRIRIAANSKATMELAGRLDLPLLAAMHVNSLPRLASMLDVYRAARATAGHAPTACGGSSHARAGVHRIDAGRRAHGHRSGTAPHRHDRAGQGAQLARRRPGRTGWRRAAGPPSTRSPPGSHRSMSTRCAAREPSSTHPTSSSTSCAGAAPSSARTARSAGSTPVA